MSSDVKHPSKTPCAIRSTARRLGDLSDWTSCSKLAVTFNKRETKRRPAFGLGNTDKMSFPVATARETWKNL